MLTELKNRGVADIFIACVDGLKGFPQAIETVFPKTQVQLGIVHLRSCLNYVSWKQRKQVAADLKPIYRASTAEDAGEKLEAVESLNMSLRKVIKTRGSFPSEEAAIKPLYLALEHIAKLWTQPLQDWKGALNRFAILLEDRLPRSVVA